MRRSAAPSKNLFAKRQKTDAGAEESEVNKELLVANTAAENNENKQELNEKQDENIIKEKYLSKKPLCSRSFVTPVLKTPPTVLAKQQENIKPDIHLENESTTDYYSVMWGKISKKKHKTWDGDGILIAKQRSVILQDVDGKIIGNGRGYKLGELANFTEGQSLCVGGKMIEISGKISKEEYLSGHCFQQTSSSSSTEPSILPKKTGPVKPFANPVKSGSTNLPAAGTSKTFATPRHDPNAPDALVMPRPSSSHQWEHNKKQQPVVDVVVDPYVATVLRPHQRDGVTFLYECVMGMRSSFAGNGAILADDMGLGKTLQCIALIWTVFKQGMYNGQASVKRILIITPGSLVKNWAVEFRKWLGNERMTVYPVNSDNKVQDFILSPVYPVMIISYEMFVRSVEEIRKIRFNLIVCDEAHRLKNSAIKTTMLISSLNVRRKILLTGTPIQNDLTEFFSLSEFCNPGIFGSQASFRRLYEEPIVRGRQPDASIEDKELGVSRANELNRLTDQFLLRRTSDINNKYLPRKMDSVVFCRPSDLQLHLYQHLVASRWFRSCFSTSYCGSSHLICIAALKKLCNHPSLLSRPPSRNEDTEVCDQDLTLYDDIQTYFPANFDADVAEHSGKLKVLANLLYYIRTCVPNDRVVVVSNYTQTLDIIQKLCERNSYQFLRLDGQTATSQRQSLVESYNRKTSPYFIFLLSSKAGGVGLNLTGGSILILFDIDWNPANDIQAMARVWRDGQKKKVKIYRLLTTGTIEEKIYQRQITKQGLSGTVGEACSSSKAEFSREDLKDLFTLNTNTTCLTHDLLNCQCALRSQEEDSVNTISLSRPCQLGSKKHGPKNLSMAELMAWSHYPRPITETKLQDEMLRTCAEDIDFVFQTETN